MSYETVLLPKWLSHQGRILVKEQFHNSYTFWAMPILIFSPVQIIMRHPLDRSFFAAPEVGLRAAPDVNFRSIFFVKSHVLTYLLKFGCLILHICAVKKPVFWRGVGEVVANFTNALVTSAAKSKSRHRFTLKLHKKIFNLEKLNSILENTFGILLQKVGTSQGTGMTCFWPSPQLLFSFYVQQFEVHIWTPHQ